MKRPRDEREPPASPFARSLHIGRLRLERRLFMAPMAGITTPAFRRSVRRWGAGLVFTEMISAYGLCYGGARTFAYLECDEDEHPIGFQLFGADADYLARAAELCAGAGADLVDLNMACPVRKVLKTGAGAALLGDHERAEEIVREVVAAVGPEVPVTVKLRAGLREGDEAGRRLAPRLVAAGAAAVFLHPRTVTQLYRGRADHGLTETLAAELPVPVVASGDVDGRYAVGAPWLFREVLGGDPPPPDERFKEVRRFADDVLRRMGPRGVRHLRQFWPKLRRGGALDRETAEALMRAGDEAAVRALLGA